MTVATATSGGGGACVAFFGLFFEQEALPAARRATVPQMRRFIRAHRDTRRSTTEHVPGLRSITDGAPHFIGDASHREIVVRGAGCWPHYTIRGSPPGAAENQNSRNSTASAPPRHQG